MLVKGSFDPPKRSHDPQVEKDTASVRVSVTVRSYHDHHNNLYEGKTFH